MQPLWYTRGESNYRIFRLGNRSTYVVDFLGDLSREFGGDLGGGGGQACGRFENLALPLKHFYAQNQGRSSQKRFSSHQIFNFLSQITSFVKPFFFPKKCFHESASITWYSPSTSHVMCYLIGAICGSHLFQDCSLKTSSEMLYIP